VLKTFLHIKIRQARKSDLPAIKNLIAKFPGELLPHHLPPVSDSMVAVDASGKIIAHVGLDISKSGFAEVRSMVVEKKYHGRGLSGMLLQRLEKNAKKKKCWELVAVTNAVKFFLRQGYKPSKKSAVLFKAL